MDLLFWSWDSLRVMESEQVKVPGLFWSIGFWIPQRVVTLQGARSWWVFSSLCVRFFSFLLLFQLRAVASTLRILPLQQLKNRGNRIKFKLRYAAKKDSFKTDEVYNFTWTAAVYYHNQETRKVHHFFSPIFERETVGGGRGCCPSHAREK